jgi:hypothetical protein
MTSQNTDLSSWDTLYISHFSSLLFVSQHSLSSTTMENCRRRFGMPPEVYLYRHTIFYSAIESLSGFPTKILYTHLVFLVRVVCAVLLNLQDLSVLTEVGDQFLVRSWIRIRTDNRNEKNILNGFLFCKFELCYGGEIQSQADDNFQSCQLRILRFCPLSPLLIPLNPLPTAAHFIIQLNRTLFKILPNKWRRNEFEICLSKQILCDERPFPPSLPLSVSCL